MQTTPSGGASQQWKLVATSNGYYKLIAQHSNKAIDVSGGSTANGATIAQWTDDGSLEQQWKPVAVANGYYRLEARHAPGKVLDVVGGSTADGATVTLWTSDGTCAQHWAVVPVGGSGPANPPPPTPTPVPGSGGNGGTTLTNPFPGMGGLAATVNVPPGSAGYSTPRIRTANDSPAASADGTGSFRIVCEYSHMSFDDPIVYPGQPNATHLHVFFGNTAVNAYSTAESIANTGNSTCSGGTANRSAYWVPALVDTQTGQPVVPSDAIWYYKTGYNGVAAAQIQPMPKGLRMIAGSASSSSTQDHAYWGCFNQYLGHFGSIPTVCGQGDYVAMTVVFPQCWNGRDLDSADHKSHMAYPSNGGCPASHPVPIPEISLNIKYLITDASAPSRWRLSSDMYSSSLPGGFSAHADWFDGWDVPVKNAWVQNCNVAAVDCHANLLGDGRELY